MASVPQPVPKWDVDQVVAFLGSIGLPQLGDSFRSNAVAGSDLIALSDDDFTTSLGCTPLQMKKIRRELEVYGIHVPKEAAAAVPAEAAAAAPASAVEPPSAAAPAPAPAPTPAGAGAGRVATLQSEVQELQIRAAATQGHAQTYAQGQQLLRQAEAELKGAAGALNVTQLSGATAAIQDVRIGTHGGGRFGRNRVAGHALDRRNDFGHNAIEMGTVHRANAQVKQAGQHIEQARRALPNLPFIEPASVQKATSGVFLNMFFTGLAGDLMQAAKVKQAKASVDQMHQQVMQALDWCTNNMAAAQAEAANLKGTAAAKQAELAAAAR